MTTTLQDSCFSSSGSKGCKIKYVRFGRIDARFTNIIPIKGIQNVYQDFDICFHLILLTTLRGRYHLHFIDEEGEAQLLPKCSPKFTKLGSGGAGNKVPF